MPINLPPKTCFISQATPIESMPFFSRELGVNLFVKREDLTGFEWSGNKIRKLEYLCNEALARKATCLITCGGIQSNHCRATAAVAARLGLRCILLLRGQEPEEWRANFLLDKIFGAEVIFLTENQYYQDMKEIRTNVESQVRQTGGRPFFIPEGGSSPLGALGYLSVWEEIGTQLGRGGVPTYFDSVVVAHGSGGTLAGLTLGKILRAKELPGLADARVIGVNVCYEKHKSYQLVHDIIWNAIQSFQLKISFLRDDFEILEGFRGLGYAQHTKEELKFIAHVARSEGILLDPTYSGKAFLGLFQTARGKNLGENVLFIHSGGGFGTFKLEQEWRDL